MATTRATDGQSPRILIVRLSAIGDVIHGMPIACALRERFPHALLAWAVEHLCFWTRVFAQNDWPIVDLYSFTSNLDTPLYGDHVHFFEEVVKLQAAFITGFLIALTD